MDIGEKLGMGEKHTEGFHGTSVGRACEIIDNGFHRGKSLFFAVTEDNPQLIANALKRAAEDTDGDPYMYAAFKANIPPTRVTKGGYEGRLEIPPKKIDKIEITDCKVYRMGPEGVELVSTIPVRKDNATSSQSSNGTTDPWL